MSQNPSLTPQPPYFYSQQQPTQSTQIQAMSQQVFQPFQAQNQDPQINAQNGYTYYPVQQNPQNQVQYLINQHTQQMQQFQYMKQMQQQQQSQIQGQQNLNQNQNINQTNQNLFQQQSQIQPNFTDSNAINNNNNNNNSSNNINNSDSLKQQPQMKIESNVNNNDGYQIPQQKDINGYTVYQIPNQNQVNHNNNQSFSSTNSIPNNQKSSQINTNFNLILDQPTTKQLKQEEPKKQVNTSQNTVNLVEVRNLDHNLQDLNQQQQQIQLQIDQQKQQNSQQIQGIKKKFINCLVHKDQILEFVCLSNNCLKQKICCKYCLQSSHSGHESISLELYMKNIGELEKNIEENNGKENQNWEKIQAIFESNTKYLKELENLNLKLNSNISKLQNSMKIIQEKQNTDSTHLKQKISSIKSICESPKQQDQLAIVNEITQLVHFFQKFQSPSVFDYPQIIETIEFNQQLQAYNEQSVQDFQFYITKAVEEQESLEKTFNYQEFKLLNQMKKEKNDVKLTQKLTRVFHLIKGKAKKRDIINFITWNSDHKELKFMKDIKEKEEKSHYQLVFSLYIKNLEILEYEQIDDSLMKWLTQQILNVYPSVKKEKEEQRKFISSKPSNKRRYCKFNPKFDIDIKNYLSSTLIDNSIKLKIQQSEKNGDNSEYNGSSDY